MITMVRSVDHVAAMKPTLETSVPIIRVGPAPYRMTEGVNKKPGEIEKMSRRHIILDGMTIYMVLCWHSLHTLLIVVCNKILSINPYKPGVLFMGHRQTEWTQM